MDIEPSLIKHAPGAVGSFLAMWRLTGMSLWQRVVSFVGGVASSYWFTDLVLQMFPVMSPAATGFVLGLFGMSLIGQGFEAVETLTFSKLVPEKFRKTTK